MRTVAAVVRHGAHEEPESVTDTPLLAPLTRRGEAQARELAQHVLELSERHALTLHPVVDSAPLLAAYQTACIVAELLSRATHRPFRVDQHAALRARSPNTDESFEDAGLRASQHLHASITGLASKSRASKLKLFIGHGSVFRHACAQLGVLDAARMPHVSMNRCQPLLLEWPTQGTWRHLDGSWKEHAASSMASELTPTER